MVARKNVYMVTEPGLEHTIRNYINFTYNTGCCFAMTLYLIFGRQISEVQGGVSSTKRRSTGKVHITTKISEAQYLSRNQVRHRTPLHICQGSSTAIEHKSIELSDKWLQQVALNSAWKREVFIPPL